MTVNIKSGPMSHEFKITDENGNQINGVTSCGISIMPGDIVTATIGICVGNVDVDAHQLLTMKSLRDAADHYGLKLVDK